MVLFYRLVNLVNIHIGYFSSISTFYSSSLLLEKKKGAISSKMVLEELKAQEKTIGKKLVYKTPPITYWEEINIYMYRGDRSLDNAIKRIYSEEGSLYGLLTIHGKSRYFIQHHGFVIYEYKWCTTSARIWKHPPEIVGGRVTRLEIFRCRRESDPFHVMQAYRSYLYFLVPEKNRD